MDEPAIQDLVKGWYQRSRRERDFTAKFVFLWVCFNARLSYESDMDGDQAMLRWLKSARPSRSQLVSSFEMAAASDVFRNHLRALVGLSPIHSTRRLNPRVIHIAGVKDFKGIVDGLYQVRCNLFHGGKRSNDVRDQKLVIAFARILDKWVGNLISGWR
jgi:hypothetical protein